MSVSGYKYYLVILDDCSHFLWTFPLRLKSDTFPTIANFFSYVRTQFGASIQNIQCDNGREFDNLSARTFFLSHGVHLRMSCPYTSPQNGKAERIIRSINNMVRSLLFQAHAPPAYWAEALATSTHLLNITPTKTLSFATPHFALHGSPPGYDQLRVFGCLCYPNLSATAPHKLAPRSARCVFLGYSAHHKGYLCLDVTTNRVIISRHVVFDETVFPFSEQPSPPSQADFEFLADDSNPVSAPIGPAQTSLPAGPLFGVPAQPRAAQAPTAQPRAAPDQAPTAQPRAASDQAPSLGVISGAGVPVLRVAAGSPPPGFFQPATAGLGYSWLATAFGRLQPAAAGVCRSWSATAGSCRSSSSPGRTSPALERLHPGVQPAATCSYTCSCPCPCPCSGPHWSSTTLTQGCGACSPCGEPALHDHSGEVGVPAAGARVPAAGAVPCQSSVADSEDLPQRPC